MARLRYCRDVTVGVCRLPNRRHFYGAQPNAGKRCRPVILEKSPQRLCGIGDFGVNGVKEVCHRTYDNTLFIVLFSGVFAWR